MPTGAAPTPSPKDAAGSTSPAGAALSWFESSVKSGVSKLMSDSSSQKNAQRMQSKLLSIAIDRMHAAFGIDRIRKPSASNASNRSGALIPVGAPECELAPSGPSWQVGSALTGAYKRLTFVGKQQLFDGTCDTRASLACAQGYIGDDMHRPVCSYEVYPRRALDYHLRQGKSHVKKRYLRS